MSLDKRFPLSSNGPHSIQKCFNNRTLGSLGIWFGDNPFDFALPITLCQIILYFIVSRTLHYVLRPLQTPKFLCCVIGGVLLGPTAIGRNVRFLDSLFPVTQAPFLTALAKIGSSYFVFIYALKLDVINNLKTAKRCWRFGVIPYYSCYFATSILLALYRPRGDQKENTTGSVYSIPNVFTISSFAVVSEALTELNLISTELGQIALSSSMVSEMLQWVTISLQFSSKTNFVLSLGFLVCTCLFGLSFFFIVRPMAKFIIQRTPVGKPVNEIYIVMILLGVLVMAGISDLLGLHFVMGPILFGLVMPNGPPLATTIIERSELINQEFLMPFFFLYVGVTTNFGGVNKHWKVALTFQAILFVGSMVKIIDDHVYSQMVLYVVLMTGICIPLIKSLYKNRSRVLIDKRIHEGGERTIQSTSNNSKFSIISCVHNETNVRSMIGLLEACNPSKGSPLYVHIVHLTELFGKSIPILLPINMKNKKSLSINYPNSSHILRAFVNYSENSKGPVTINSYINVSPYHTMHEAICNLAEDKLVHFLIIPFHENEQSLGNNVGSTIRELNSNFQACAQCTVGILVDRYSQISTSATNLSFNVAIFFVGGQDDREALALGIRMFDRPNTNVTLFCFIFHNISSNSNNRSGVVEYKVDDKDYEIYESMLDENLIDEFKAKKINNDNVVCREIVVDDCNQMLEAIRGLENEDYDLVMVGKRHNIGDLTDEEMSNFMDNAILLGVFGDMLASTEFCNGKVPILVLQCGDKRVNQFNTLF
ncbi:unnamed protein product [Lathyrus sativus]|nr:unnamed protein product [Lathyrus sativus]